MKKLLTWLRPGKNTQVSPNEGYYAIIRQYEKELQVLRAEHNAFALRRNADVLNLVNGVKQMLVRFLDLAKENTRDSNIAADVVAQYEDKDKALADWVKGLAQNSKRLSDSFEQAHAAAVKQLDDITDQLKQQLPTETPS